MAAGRGEGAFGRLHQLTDRAARLTDLAGGPDRARLRVRGGGEPARALALLSLARAEEALVLSWYGMSDGRVAREMRPAPASRRRVRAARHRGRGRQ
jgi:hypothetical protein